MSKSKVYNVALTPKPPYGLSLWKRSSIPDIIINVALKSGSTLNPNIALYEFRVRIPKSAIGTTNFFMDDTSLVL